MDGSALWGQFRIFQANILYSILSGIDQTVVGARPLWVVSIINRINVSPIASNLNMPQSVKDLGIRVSVIAKFVIDEDGNVTEISMYKGFNKEVDTEAMRVVGLLKKFTPGFLDGQSVKMKYFLPLTFSGNIK